MNEDLEITIKVIPAGDDNSHEDNMKAAHEVMDALYKAFKGHYDKEDLERRTIIKEGTKEDLPAIFKKFGLDPEDAYKPNKYNRNKNYYRRRR